MASMLCITAFAAESADGVVLTVSGQIKDGTTVKIEDYKNFEDGWEAAVDYAENDDFIEEKEFERIVVDLYADWTAKNGSFGSGGDGFSSGAIYFPGSTKITLNLNGHTLNRGLSIWKWNGEVIYVGVKADVIINNGTVTGGNSGGGAGGIHIDDDSTVELNNVHIVGNISDDDDGGGIAIYDDATLIMNGGSFKNNSIDGFVPTSEHEIFPRSYYGGAIYVYDSTVNLKNVEFKNNQTTTESNHGAAIYADDSEIKMWGCVFDGNGIEDTSKNIYAAYSVIYAEDSCLHISGTTFTNNGAKKTNAPEIGYSSVIALDDSTLQMQQGEANNKFSNNNSYFLINDGDNSEIFVWDTDFLDNAASVLYGDNQTVSDSSFNRCKFNNNVSGKFVSFYDVNTTLTFNDCDMGDSTYEDTKYLRFVENGVEKKASTGSIFSEGSLTMIVAFIALIASVASIVVNITTKKKKAIVATGTEQTENNE
jgi:hypothetical protein